MASTHDLTAKKLFNVENWVAVVTGGGTGIGLMCAQALAANGARVYITSRRKEKLTQSAHQHTPGSTGSIIPIVSDVTDKESLSQLVTQISQTEDHIDTLICNAGISGPRTEPAEANADDLKSKLWNNEDFASWSSVFTTNVSAVYFTTIAFLPLLQRSPHGNVITISSMSGLTKSAQGHFAYNSAKAATIHLTKLMSAEFEKTGVRVNSIAPGYFPSEMTTGKSEGATAKSEGFLEEGGEGKYWEKEKGVPAGRAGVDEEMAMATLFLARCGYVNSEVLVVDGGALLTLGTR